jgi:transposase
VVKQFISDSNGKIELYFLPPYAPDLNPDEFVWNHLKRHGLSKKPLTKNEALRTRVERDLAAIKKSPRLIRSFFRAKSVAYISA